MKFAYSTRIFRWRALPEAVTSIVAAGFHAVELLADRPHAFPEDLKGADVTVLNGCMEDKKVAIANLNSCVVMALGDSHRPSWIEEDWMEREKRIRYTLDCLRLAAAMGVPSVSTVGGGVIPESMHQGEAWRLFVANMHRILPLADRLGIQLLLQPEPDMLLQTSHQLVKFLGELNETGRLGVNFNVAHVYCAGEDPLEAWDRVRDHVGHVELSDAPASRKHQHVQLGEGDIDIPGFLHHLEASGYEGFVTIEMESQEHDPAGVVTDSANYLKKHGFLLQSENGCQRSGRKFP